MVDVYQGPPRYSAPRKRRSPWLVLGIVGLGFTAGAIAIYVSTRPKPDGGGGGGDGGGGGGDPKTCPTGYSGTYPDCKAPPPQYALRVLVTDVSGTTLPPNFLVEVIVYGGSATPITSCITSLGGEGTQECTVRVPSGFYIVRVTGFTATQRFLGTVFKSVTSDTTVRVSPQVSGGR